MAHGDWCRTRTYPTRCRICRADVFYFSCTCGSKVFFDSLGSPWPLHRCGDHIDYDGLVNFMGKEALARGLETSMSAPGWLIEGAYERRIVRAARQPRKRRKVRERQILRQDTYGGLKTEETGFVREFTPEVDLHGRLGVPQTAAGAAVLGELGRASFAQITIQTAALGDEDDFSYTFFVEAARVASLSIQMGGLVQCRLRGVDILGRSAVWICDEIEVVG